MANSTFYDFTQALMDRHGEPRFDSTSQFNSGPWSKLQLQAKSWTSVLHAMLMGSARWSFLLKDYEITTSDASNSYAISEETNYERIEVDSMRITTTGEECPQLDYVPINEYRKEYPSENESQGKPRRWFLRRRAAGVDYVGFSAPPDGEYDIAFSAFIKPYKLVNATDLIAIPPEWEHVFIFADALFLEYCKSEGKAPDYAPFLERCLTEMEACVLAPPDEVLRINPGFSFTGRKQKSWIDW